MGYGALTAFIEHGFAEVTILDQARRLVHHDFKKAGIHLGGVVEEDEAARLIAKLIEQEIERAAK